MEREGGSEKNRVKRRQEGNVEIEGRYREKRKVR